MLAEMWQWMQFDFWRSLACLAVGAVIIFPLLLNKSFRRRVNGFRSDDLEAIGLIVLVLAIVGIGLYNNYFGSGTGT